MQSIATSPCPHCGKARPANKFVEYAGKQYAVGYEPCDCPEALKEQAECKQAEAEAAKWRAWNVWNKKLDKAHIPLKFVRATSDRKDLVKLIRGGKGLYIQGPFGVGKSHLAAALAIEFIRAGERVNFISDQQIVSRIRSTFHGEGTEEELFRELLKPYLLVIDDLGKVAPSEWSVSMLYRVIEERDLAMKPCVFTSNYTKAELAERFTVNGDSRTAEALVSRLFGTTQKVELAGEDRRMQ